MSISFPIRKPLVLFIIGVLAVVLSGCRASSAPGSNRAAHLTATARAAAPLVLDKNTTREKYRALFKYQRGDDSQTTDMWTAFFTLYVTGQKPNVTAIHATIYDEDGVTIREERDIHVRSNTNSKDMKFTISGIQLPFCGPRKNICTHSFIVVLDIVDERSDSINFVPKLTAEESVYLNISTRISFRKKCYVDFICIAPAKSDAIRPSVEITRIGIDKPPVL